LITLDDPKGHRQPVRSATLETARLLILHLTIFRALCVGMPTVKNRLTFVFRPVIDSYFRDCL